MLAYYENTSITTVKCFIGLAPGGNTVKLNTRVTWGFESKLYRSSCSVQGVQNGLAYEAAFNVYDRKIFIVMGHVQERRLEEIRAGKKEKKQTLKMNEKEGELTNKFVAQKIYFFSTWKWDGEEKKWIGKMFGEIGNNHRAREEEEVCGRKE